MRITKITERHIEDLSKAISLNETLLKRFQQQWDRSTQEFGLLEKYARDNGVYQSWPFVFQVLSEDERSQKDNPYKTAHEIVPDMEVKAVSTRFRLFVNKPAGVIVGLISHDLPIPLLDIVFSLKPRTNDALGLQFDISGRYKEVHDIAALVDAIMADLFFIDLPIEDQ